MRVETFAQNKNQTVRSESWTRTNTKKKGRAVNHGQSWFQSRETTLLRARYDNVYKIPFAFVSLLFYREKINGGQCCKGKRRRICGAFFILTKSARPKQDVHSKKYIRGLFFFSMVSSRAKNKNETGDQNMSANHTGCY